MITALPNNKRDGHTRVAIAFQTVSLGYGERPKSPTSIEDIYDQNSSRTLVLTTTDGWNIDASSISPVGLRMCAMGPRIVEPVEVTLMVTFARSNAVLTHPVSSRPSTRRNGAGSTGLAGTPARPPRQAP